MAHRLDRDQASASLVELPRSAFAEGSVNLAEASWVLGRVGPGLRGHEAHVTAFHSANARVRSPR